MIADTVSTEVLRGPSVVLKPYETRRLLKLPDKRTKHGARDACLLAILALGGLRSCEAVALRVDNVEPYPDGKLPVTHGARHKPDR